MRGHDQTAPNKRSVIFAKGRVITRASESLSSSKRKARVNSQRCAQQLIRPEPPQLGISSSIWMPGQIIPARLIRALSRIHLFRGAGTINPRY
jgi:hypothetical protein